jgi:hypothetical protein
MGSFSGQAHGRVSLSADLLSWFRTFSKKEDFLQRIRNNQSAVVTKLKLLFAANKSDVLAFMTPEAGDSVVVQLIVDAQGAKKVVIYGSATACPEWVVALVDACVFVSPEGWSIKKLGGGFFVLAVTSVVIAKKASSWQSKRRVAQAEAAIAKAEAAAEEAKEIAASAQEGSPNKKDQYGLTPLHYAVARGDLTELLRLLKNGANPNIQDKEGNTALHYALAFYTDEAILSLIPEQIISMINTLNSFGANLNILNTHGCTAAHEVFMRRFNTIEGNMLILKKLRELGANFDIKGVGGYYKGKSVNDILNEGRSPLSFYFKTKLDKLRCLIRNLLN